MTKIRMRDAVTVSQTRETTDGYLVAEAKAVRTGIQVYNGTEVGKADMATVRVYRSPEEVFSADSLQSFSHAPMTLDHPSEGVTADNWKRLAVGETSGEAIRDGEWLRLPLIVKDRRAIDAIRSGKRQLSAGYTCDLDFTAGKTPGGEAYDAVQRNIRINHLAIVDQARAGAAAAISDSAGNGQAMRDAAREEWIEHHYGAPVPGSHSDNSPARPASVADQTMADAQAQRDAARQAYLNNLMGGAQ